MILLIACLVVFLLFSPASDAISIATGGAAPDFTLNSVEGKTLSLSNFKDQIVVIIYWRTEHKRSLLALKDARDVLKNFKGKEVKGISVIAGSDSQSKAQDILKDNGIDYPLLVDAERRLYNDYGIQVYPTTVIIDKEGILAHDLPSHPLTYKAILTGFLKKALGEIDEGELQEILSPHNEKEDKAMLEAHRLYNLAMKFTKSGMLDLAISTARKSVEAKPELAQSHILLGYLYLETMEADKAYEAFNKALELDYHSSDAKTGLGGALILMGKIDSAIEILDSATVANPYPQMTYYELGKAYELKGDMDKSTEMYKKAIEKIIHKQILPSSISRCQ